MTATIAIEELESVLETPETSPLVEVQGLNVAFGRGPEQNQVVQDVSLELHPGQCVALVGESGSGKSVTARTLVGLTGENSVVDAEVLNISEHDVLNYSEKAWRTLRGRKIGFVSQDALVALDPFRKVGAEVAESLRIHTNLNASERKEKATAALADVGIPDPEVRAQQRSFELSGGLRQRAVIASALVTDPSVLIADEPTTALDVTLQAQILSLLAQAKQRGTAILLISHDLAVVSALADHVLVMKDGEIVERGPAQDVLHSPQHPYTRQLRDAVPRAETREKRLAPHLPSQAAKIADARPDVVKAGSILQAKNLHKSFKTPGRGINHAVAGVSLEVSAGQTVGIVGESGSGKSTTARIIADLAAADSGEVLLRGSTWSTLKDKHKRKLRRKIGFIYQDPLSSFDPRWSVEKILKDALLFGPQSSLSLKDRAAVLLELVDLPTSFLQRHPLQLSGGQRQRIAIARALATSPDVIICDEPVSALDVSVQATVLDLLKDLQKALGLAYVFISHDLGVVHHVSDDVLVMKDGEVVESGAADDVFTAPQHPYTQKLLTALPSLVG